MSTMRSYVVPCSSLFRNAISDIADTRGLTVSDLAMGILTLTDRKDLERFPDPGDAPVGDRDEILLKSGPRSGRVLKRKPRLQLRLPDGYDIPTIRRGLAMVLAMEDGTVRVSFRSPAASHDPPHRAEPDTSAQDALKRERHHHRQELEAIKRTSAKAQEEREEMRALVNILAFDLLPTGISTVADARYVLGFPPSAALTKQTVKARFRLLSQIYHPDKTTGDTARMGQLIEASRFLERRMMYGSL